MPTSSTMPTTRKRRRKTRTSQVSHRPPILASDVEHRHLELTPGKEHVVCPDCGTWCPITGMQGTPKLAPHHTKRVGTSNPRRCSGSNRQILLEVTVGQWHTDRFEAVPDTRSRRATKVLPKPKATSTPAASQLKPTPLNAERVRQVFRQHQERCAACKGEVTDSNGELLPCRDGERLAATFLRLLRQEPKRSAVRAFFARERARLDRRYAAAAVAKRPDEWAAVLPAVRAADAQRAQLPAGDAPTESPSVPQDTLHLRLRTGRTP